MSSRPPMPSRGPLNRTGNLGKPGEKAKNFKQTFRRFLGFMKPYYGALLFIFLLALLGNVFNIIGPRVLGEATNKIVEGITTHRPIDFNSIGIILLILAGLYLLGSGFQYLQQLVTARICQKAIQVLRTQIYDKINRLPLKVLDSRGRGELLSRVTNDIDTIGTTLQQILTQFIGAFITVIGTLLMMFFISPLLTLIALCCVPLMVIGTRFVTKRSKQHFKEQQKALGEVTGHIEETFSGHQVIKVFAQEKKTIEKFEKDNQALYESGRKAQFVSSLIMPITGFINNLGYVAVCVAGGFLCSFRIVTIGDIQAFIQYLRQFTMPLLQLADMANVLQSTLACAERSFELLDEEEETDAGTQQLKPEESRGEILFQNVCFSYAKGTKLMENLNLRVKSGQTIAVVGPTGAGKTTLVNLLLRFYELDSGQIFLDGKDITDLKRGNLRAHFGMVLQDTWLFKGTIKENIAFGREFATDQDIYKAALTAHADHFIRALPQGYDTYLDEEASNLSQGQRQLITIARAVLADPPILILDEASSSVDTRTELYIQKAMTALMSSRTSFVIAHRLSTIRDADLILVMNQGAVVEQGSHTELLTTDGFYANLYKSQFLGNEQEE